MMMVAAHAESEGLSLGVQAWPEVVHMRAQSSTFNIEIVATSRAAPCDRARRVVSCQAASLRAACASSNIA